jgi:hypothetical protein
MDQNYICGEMKSSRRNTCPFLSREQELMSFRYLFDEMLFDSSAMRLGRWSEE